MSERERETYENLLKVPGIYESTYPNYEALIYLTVIGREITASIQIHISGNFSFVVQTSEDSYDVGDCYIKTDRGRYRYIKDVDAFMEKLYPSTVVGLAFHLDKLYIP